MPTVAGEVVARATGGWFAVDDREVKDTTLEGGAIIGDETNVVLQSSANAWGENGGGTSATITWSSTSGNSGTVASATTADSVNWLPEARFGTNTLVYVSGGVVKSAKFLVVCHPDGGPYKQIVDGVEWTFFVDGGMAMIGCDTASAVPASTVGDVVIPEDFEGTPVVDVHSNAFMNCDRLTAITVSSSVTNIGYGAFDGCIALSNICVVVDNQDYASFDGVLYDKSVTSLIRCPLAKLEVSIPPTVTKIDSKAFDGCDGLRVVKVDVDDVERMRNLFVTSGIPVENLEFRAAFGTCHVTFDLGDKGIRVGGGELAQEVKFGEAAVAPEVSANYGWVFTKWDRDFSSVTGHLAVAACWQKAKWSVEVTGPDGKTASKLVEHGEVIELVAPDPLVDESERMRIISLGTTYTAPTVTNRFELTVTSAVSVVWNILATNYWFECQQPTLGRISAPEDGWKRDGEQFELTAIPDDHCHFAAWSGDVVGCAVDGNAISVVMDRARTIGAEISMTRETVGGVTWDYVLRNGIAVIDNNGRLAAEGATEGTLIIPATLRGRSVGEIGVGALCGCAGVTEVIVPQSVTNIAESAFEGCGSLESVELPASVAGIGTAAFASCSNLVSLTLPEGMTAIMPMTFANCMSLEAIELPEAVQSIGEEAFCGCSALTRIDIPEGVTAIPYRAFADCAKLYVVNLPEGLAGIGEEAFAGCASLGSITIPESVEEIAVGAFADCNGLKSVTFLGQPPKGVKESGLVAEGVTIRGPAEVEISPDDGTVFSGELSVSLTTGWAGGVVRYTLDGSEPTVESPVFDGITVHSKKTVRAAVFVDGLRWGEIAEATYGVGKVATPEITSTMGDEFSHNGNVVSIACATKGVEIRYAFGGTEPTTNSTLYTGEFEISRSTTVNAKAFGHPDYVDSDVATRQFTRVWEGLATPTISPAGGTFAAECCQVTMDCESEGATIYYTLDGSEPSATNGRMYKGPFMLYQTAKIRAVATKFDNRDSDIAVANFERENSLGEAVNCYGALVDTDEKNPWTVDGETSHDGVSSAKSAAVESGTSCLKFTVKGEGRLSFWWKASCEASWKGEYYDYGSFKVGGVEAARIAGQTEWQQFVTNFTTAGKHSLRWEYTKDYDGRTGYDCIWVDQVVWIPADGSGQTLTTGVPVPYSWLEAYGLGPSTDFESAGNAKTGKRSFEGKQLTVWEDYVIGADPTNVNSVFTTEIELDGLFPKITWKPDLNENGTKNLRVYKIWGRKTLNDDNTWEYPTNSLHRFFKVSVEMP